MVQCSAQQAAEAKRLRAALTHLRLQQQVAAWCTWRAEAGRLRRQLQLVRRGVQRLRMLKLAAGMGQWREIGKELRGQQERAQYAVIRIVRGSLAKATFKWRSEALEARQHTRVMRRAFGYMKNKQMGIGWRRMQGVFQEHSHQKAAMRTAILKAQRKTLNVAFNQTRYQAAFEGDLEHKVKRAILRVINLRMCRLFLLWQQATEMAMTNLIKMRKCIIRMQLTWLELGLDALRTAARDARLQAQASELVMRRLTEWRSMKSFHYWVVKARTRKHAREVEDQEDALLLACSDRMRDLVRDGAPPPHNATEMELRVYAEIASKELRGMSRAHPSLSP